MKRLAAVLATLLGLFIAPVAAHAASESAVVALHTQDDNSGDDSGSSDDNGDHQHHGDNSAGSYNGSDDVNAADQDDPFVVPPVAINPEVRSGSVRPILGAHPGNLPPRGTGDKDAKSDRPIDLPGVHPQAKTPVQQFVDTATVGLGAIGAGALTLGAAVMVRTIRNRKNGKKFDYFYGD
jgi:hypothetical protein